MRSWWRSFTTWKSRQTSAEQVEKSKGHGEAQHLNEIGQLHATLRLESGFKLGQMVAEYRALRASVLRLWGRAGVDPEGVTRFNESIDEALTEAVTHFTTKSEHYRDQSLGILGHDLRNPLNGVMFGANLLVNADELGDRNVRIAARILNSANRMNRMIGDLLDLTRTRFGESIPIVRAPIDLDPVCGQIIAELEGLHLSGGLHFTARGDLRGDWDSDRIAQVLSNLVRNAIQHGAADRPVTIVADGDGDEVVLSVHNEGHAIPANALPAIFEPMARHVSDERKNVGLGLGLYIAAQILIAHAATIDVASTEADGTRFTVHLPRHAPPLRAPRLAATHPHDEPVTHNGQA